MRGLTHRMLGRAFSITAILLMAAFAGCISKGDEPSDDLDRNNQNATGFADESDRMAPDGRGELSAFKETNRTETNGTGAMDHKHDYWRGQTRIDIAYINSGLIPFPLFPCKEAGTCTLGGGGETYPAGTAIADYDIEKPHLVYEGTDHLEVTLVHSSLPDFCVRQASVCTPRVAHPAVHPMIDYLTAAAPTPCGPGPTASPAPAMRRASSSTRRRPGSMRMSSSAARPPETRCGEPDSTARWRRARSSISATDTPAPRTPPRRSSSSRWPVRRRSRSSRAARSASETSPRPGCA